MEVHVDKQNLIDIANSLRTKKGEPSTKKYKVSEMAEGIDDIETFVVPDGMTFGFSTNLPNNLDFSNVINMTNMFKNCSSNALLIVSNIDTSNVTNMVAMFGSCDATDLDLSNFDTTNVTNMASMFNSCSFLTNLNVDSFDCKNVTSMDYMFGSCPRLSDNSLNSILKMCSTATKVNNKTLKAMYITSSQATRCQSLSNYQAFLEAGWTTGY